MASNPANTAAMIGLGLDLALEAVQILTIVKDAAAADREITAEEIEAARSDRQAAMDRFDQVIADLRNRSVDPVAGEG